MTRTCVRCGIAGEDVVLRDNGIPNHRTPTVCINKLLTCVKSLQQQRTDLRARVAELETDVLAQNDMLKDLGESRQAALDRVAELERVTEEQELLDFMEQQGTSWSPAPFRAVRGTGWAVRAEHDIGDTPTLREVLRIARVRALTAARGGG